MARPREFDPDEALEAIMHVFWERGFEGTSLNDIEVATGLNKQSLYRVFRDKRDMYLRSLIRYDETEVAAAAKILGSPGSARDRFKRLFDDVLSTAIRYNDRRGCFLCNAATDQAQLDDDANAHIKRSMGAVSARSGMRWAHQRHTKTTRP